MFEGHKEREGGKWNTSMCKARKGKNKQKLPIQSSRDYTRAKEGKNRR